MGLCQTEDLEGLVLVYERVSCGSLYAFLHNKVSNSSVFWSALSPAIQLSRYLFQSSPKISHLSGSETQIFWTGKLKSYSHDTQNL